MKPRVKNRFSGSQGSVGRRGAAAVEFAMTFPIILLFFMAMVSLTQIYILRATSEMAAFAGAREGTVVGATESDIRREAEQVMKTVGASVYEIKINRNADSVEVDVTVPMDGNAWATCRNFPICLLYTSPSPRDIS